MLCRTASDLYWAARNMERAENTARLIDVTIRNSMLPERLDSGKAEAAPWRRALEALGDDEAYLERHGRIEADAVLHHLLLAPDNPSSIYNCFRAAREAARAQRVAITSEMYEDLNTSWLEVRQFQDAGITRDGINAILDRVKSRSASFRGVTIGTLGRGERYRFLQLGTFIERGCWAIRLLDVVGSDRQHAEAGETRDAMDYFQWSGLLQALSAFETYRRLYRQTVSAANVAELMLLNDANPRSLQTCAHNLHQVLRSLGDDKLEVVRKAGGMEAQTRYATIDEIIGNGLEPWLQGAMTRLFDLGDEIHRQFMSANDAIQSQPYFQSQFQ